MHRNHQPFPGQLAVRLAVLVRQRVAVMLGVKSEQIPGVVLRRRIHGANHGILRRDAQSDYLRVVKAAMDRRRQARGSA